MRTKEGEGEGAKPDNSVGRERKRSWLWRAGLILLILAAIATAVRLILPSFITKYVNRTLQKNPLYAGTIHGVQLHLWRGAYSIEEIRLSKVTGNIPVPLFGAKRVDLSLQRSALWNRKIVGQVVIEQPELNFVDAPSEGEQQTGAGGPWLQMIEELFPFRINRCTIHQGTVHFRAYQKEMPVDVYLSNVSVLATAAIGSSSVPASVG